MIERWIESVFIKRVVLSLASGAAAWLAVHSLPGAETLSAWGVVITVTIDPHKFADAATIASMALAQGLHEWIAVKYPALGKYI